MATVKKTTEKNTAALQAKVFSAVGKETGSMELPAALFGLPWNADLVHQVVTSMQSNARLGLAHAKTRAEVRGGGKKPWKQKGTGRARHGSSRSPIWVGGGTTHGPRNEKSYARTISRKMREKALLVALSRKVTDGEVAVVEKMSMDTPQTAKAKALLTGLATAGFPMKRTNAALVIVPDANRAIVKSFANFGNVETIEARNLNPVAVLEKKYVVITDPQAVIDALSKKKVVKKAAN